jgi:hypothetical protein
MAAVAAIEKVTGVYSSYVRCTSAWIGEQEYRRLKEASDPKTQVLDKPAIDKLSDAIRRLSEAPQPMTTEEMARRQAEGLRQRWPLTSAEIAGALNWVSYLESLGWSRGKAIEPESPGLWARLKKRWNEIVSNWLRGDR